MRRRAAALLVLLLLGGPQSLSAIQHASDTSVSDVAHVTGVWSNATQSQGPPPLAGQGMVYSLNQSRFYMFGGQVPSYLTESRTWSYDPASSRWSLVQASGPVPKGRADPIMTLATDKNGRECVFLFGGWYNDSNGVVGRLDDTWLFYPASQRWVQLSAVNAPSPRSDSAVGYDGHTAQVWIYGGYNGTYLSDLWVFSMLNESWSKITHVSIPNPPPLSDARMGFDSSDGVMVMFGGNNGLNLTLGFNHYDTTWVLDSTTYAWRNFTQGTTPLPRDYAFFAYDNGDDLFVLFGGYGQSVPLGDTWTYDYPGNVWNQLGTPLSPPSRYAGGSAYDPADRLFLVYGGVHGEEYLSDTWTLRLASTDGSHFTYALQLAAVLLLGIATAVFLWVKRRPGRQSKAAIPTTGERPGLFQSRLPRELTFSREGDHEDGETDHLQRRIEHHPEVHPGLPGRSLEAGRRPQEP